MLLPVAGETIGNIKDIASLLPGGYHDWGSFEQVTTCCGSGNDSTLTFPFPMYPPEWTSVPYPVCPPRSQHSIRLPFASCLISHSQESCWSLVNPCAPLGLPWCRNPTGHCNPLPRSAMHLHRGWLPWWVTLWYSSHLSAFSTVATPTFGRWSWPQKNRVCSDHKNISESSVLSSSRRLTVAWISPFSNCAILDLQLTWAKSRPFWSQWKCTGARTSLYSCQIFWLKHIAY